MEKRPPASQPPNDDFSRQELTLAHIAPESDWFRLHKAELSPVYFGRTGEGRFDSPNSAFGTLYLARDLAGAFVEVFCRQAVRAATGKWLNSFHLAKFNAERTLTLVDLTGPGSVRMGLGDARLTSGDYSIAQLWTQAFHNHPERPDGVLYRSRHDPEQELAAIFSRTESIWRNQSCGTLGEHLDNDQLFALLDRYDFELLPF